MAFTVGMSTTSVIDTEITEELIAEFLVSYTQLNVTEPLVEFQRNIGAKSVAFPIFDSLSAATTPLTEDVDPDSTAMSDSEVILTPVEYGNVITRTSLADLQTGGRASMAAMRLIGENMAKTNDALAVAALEASSNVMYINSGTISTGGAVGSTASTDIMSGDFLNAVYNKMARSNVPVHPLVGAYVALLHDDQIHDLRAGTAAGSWVDVNKYNNELPVLNNEVGMYKGFRILRNNHCSITTDGGVTTTDTYKASFLGGNGLGKAESQMPEIRITGPFDKLGRFLNIGWYAVQQYKIIQSSAVWTGVTASSVGVNS